MKFWTSDNVLELYNVSTRVSAKLHCFTYFFFLCTSYFSMFSTLANFLQNMRRSIFSVSLGGGSPEIVTLNSEYWVHTAPNHLLLNINCWHSTGTQTRVHWIKNTNRTLNIFISEVDFIWFFESRMSVDEHPRYMVDWTLTFVFRVPALFLHSWGLSNCLGWN